MLGGENHAVSAYVSADAAIGTQTDDQSRKPRADSSPLAGAGGAQSSGAFEYGEDVEQLIAQARGRRPLGVRLSQWRQWLTYRNVYMVVSVLSFGLMGIFGALSMVPYKDCFVSDPNGRCCKCITTIPAKMVGQAPDVPRELSLNGVWYGLAMMVNSGFGIYYVVNGVRAENKYQLLCMLVTQAIECVRGMVDTWLEAPDDSAGRHRRTAQEFLMIMAALLLLMCCALVMPVYKSFGWRIFYRGGARQSVRSAYKWYQRFRALNRIDVQSSFLLFLLFVTYVNVLGSDAIMSWVFIALLVCDILASRWVVKFVKREDTRGLIIGLVAKTFVVVWWIVVLQEYLSCYMRYQESRAATKDWWSLPLYPSLVSAAESYNGVRCLAKYSYPDQRALHAIVVNFIFAIVFRFASIVVLWRVHGNFGRGLRRIFYRVESGAAQRDMDARERSAGETAGDDSQTFVFNRSDSGAGRSADSTVPRLRRRTEEELDAGSEISDSELVADESGW